MPLCSATTTYGNPCAAYAQDTSDFCFSHDPASRDRFVEASAIGGRNSSRIPRFIEREDVEEADPEETLTLIVNRLLTGELDPRAAAPAIRALAVLLRRNDRWKDDLTPEESAIFGDGFRYQGD